MGLIERAFTLVFGNGRNVVKETAEVFQENAEAASAREVKLQGAALAQFGDEFNQPVRGLFDRVMDAINRLPRPALALGTLGLFVSAMVDPVWFAARMQGVALVPEPLWWLLGAIVSFYFGARHQAKGQEFQRHVTRTLAMTPRVVGNLQTLDSLERGAQRPAMAGTGADAVLTLDSLETANNPALADWARDADQGR
ncbi:holin family protein [Alisedimentitalea sp. MJ-SS2]|uniref:holin family protein n=1 Tax=Aliisedimentitalea sp. MJ-SS2 TaxID=3049795 RepID=UPI00291082A2|nr:holin family protein [Alisedimentitalea sp. MJ-SS2]MDU8929748.1 holin family protein [Alisedimentitalea sp. MJ-SS2]